MWAVPLAYVLLPFLVGSTVGTATTRKRAWAIALTGRRRAPRAWDSFFSAGPTGWVRMKLKSGTWVGGFFIDKPGSGTSYAAQQHAGEQDIYLAIQAVVDPVTGGFATNESGSAIARGSGMLIRWDEVEYLEFSEDSRIPGG